MKDGEREWGGCHVGDAQIDFCNTEVDLKTIPTVMSFDFLKVFSLFRIFATTWAQLTRENKIQNKTMRGY